MRYHSASLGTLVRGGVAGGASLGMGEVERTASGRLVRTGEEGGWIPRGEEDEEEREG